MSKRILILHASLGSGHVSAAHALGDAFTRLGVTDVIIEDTLDYASSLLRSTFNTAYQKMCERAPFLWKSLFDTTDTDDAEESIRDNLRLGRLGYPFLRQLKKLVEKTNPDAIICTMPFPAMVFGRLKKQGKLSVPLYVVITDFVAHSTWFNYGVNGYFLPGEVTQFQFLARGHDPQLLRVTGIPVKLEIAEPKPMVDMRAKHALSVHKPLLTIFGGGLVPARVHTMLAMLQESTATATVVVVAGRNNKLTAALGDLSVGPNMELIKFERIDFVDDLVAASDLVITKAGGLITSEVLARGTPMIIIDPIPGQEEWNADVVAGCGAGVQLRMPEMAAQTALQLLADPDRLADMRRRSQRVGRPRAALDVAQQVLTELDAKTPGQS